MSGATTLAQTAPPTGLQVVPTGAVLGAEVRGVDLRRLTEAEFAAILAAWHAHAVLLFRGQSLTPDELIGFSRRFGALDHAPVQEHGQSIVAGRPELYIVSNVLDDAGKPIGSLGNGEAVWHTDMSYLPRPPKASMLYALEIPPAGGDTHFASMYAAHDSLPPALRARAQGLMVKHDGTYNSGGFLRAGVTPTDDPRTAPGHLHPLVCRHPDTGRSMLYLGRRRMAYIDGLSLAESEALLDELWSYATKPALCWKNAWRVGDLVLWDNRCTMHRRDPFDAAARRVMHRTQVKGEAPPMA
jgi:taurine dioxygenase